uniref:Uncharacterized protein n=1 Tax=Junco hyemalis TaxID=40217 RepID=A0A8C5JS20_JUNHY
MSTTTKSHPCLHVLRHPLKSQILLFSPVQPARFYLFIFFFVSSSHFYYFSLCPDLFLHCALLPLLSILMASVHCRLLSPANETDESRMSSHFKK